MTFEEVLPALREGKKIRKASWWEGHYFKLASDGIVDQDGKSFTFGKDDLCCSDWEVVKETKKVKLRDLTTQEQLEKWKERNCEGSKCKDCVFNQNKVNCIYIAYCWIKDKSIFSDKFLDQEVEIEE